MTVTGGVPCRQSRAPYPSLPRTTTHVISGPGRAHPCIVLPSRASIIIDEPGALDGKSHQNKLMFHKMWAYPQAAPPQAMNPAGRVLCRGKQSTRRQKGTRQHGSSKAQGIYPDRAADRRGDHCDPGRDRCAQFPGSPGPFQGQPPPVRHAHQRRGDRGLPDRLQRRDAVQGSTGPVP